MTFERRVTELFDSWGLCGLYIAPQHLATCKELFVHAMQQHCRWQTTDVCFVVNLSLWDNLFVRTERSFQVEFKSVLLFEPPDIL